MSRARRSRPATRRPSCVPGRIPSSPTVRSPGRRRRAAVGEDEANSWLPFTGRDDLKESVAAYIERRGGPRYGRGEIVITCGEGDAMLNALFCLTDPGDEVVLTDPTYAGMLNRVRLVGASPRLVSLRVVDGEWRLGLEAPSAAAGERTRVVLA